MAGVRYLVRDVPASISFYVDWLGFELAQQFGPAMAIVRRGDLSPASLVEKARWVIAEQERRLAALGFGWGDVSATQVYTVHDIHALFSSELVRCGAAAGGITWHYVRPPIIDIEYEMDCRGVYRELVL